MIFFVGFILIVANMWCIVYLKPPMRILNVIAIVLLIIVFMFRFLS